MVLFFLGTAFGTCVGAAGLYAALQSWPKFINWVDAEIIAIRARLKP